MIKIPIFGTSSLTLAAHVSFHNAISAALCTTSLEPIKMDQIVDEHTKLIEAEIAVVNRPTTYFSTDEIVKTNRERGMAVMLFFKIIDAYLFSPIKEAAEAAHDLSVVITPYRGITSHEYNRQTTEIEGLLVALKNTTFNLETLKIASLVPDIETYNNAFKNAMFNRVDEMAKRFPVSSQETKKLRADTDECYAQIVDMLNANAVLTPTELVTKLIASINAVIVEYKRVVANQRKKIQKDEPTETVVPVDNEMIEPEVEEQPEEV